MYRIYADGNILYSPELAQEGCHVISPKLTVELNKAGELEFTIPPNNHLYSSINKLKSIITVFQNDEEIFRGRVLHDEKDFYNCKKTYCEGELTFLLDSKQRPYSFPQLTPAEMFRQYIGNHNARVENNKKFNAGLITISGSDQVIPGTSTSSGSSGSSNTLSVSKSVQFENEKESSSFGDRHLVGASHYGWETLDNGDRIPSRLYNLWMRYDIVMPKTCSKLDFVATYSEVNGTTTGQSLSYRTKVVANSDFRYSVGTESAPGSSFSTFRWNTDKKTMEGSIEGEFRSGTTIYLWLHYNYVGRNLCYVEGVNLTSIKGTTSSGASVSEATEPWFSNKNYSTTLNEITEKLLSRYGGYIKTRSEGTGRYIDWLETSGGEINQTIEFGSNLIDISEYITAENIYTVLIPIGASISDSDGNVTGNLTIEGVTKNGVDYVENQTAISLFGRIEETIEWSEIDDAAQLKKLAEDAVSKNIELSVTLTVKAIDLHLLNVETEEIHVGDWVRVISLPHSLNALFQCTKITYDMANPDNNEYIFGIPSSSLTEKQATGERQIQSSTSVAQTAAGAANATSAVIAHLPTEYVKTSVFESYKNEVEEDFVPKIEFDALVARVEELEGGTT